MNRRAQGALLIIGLAVALAASPVEARGITYDEAISIALNENPDLLGLQNQSESLKAKSTQALAPANPVVFAGKQDSTTAQPMNISGGTFVGASINLGFPGKAFVQRHTIRYQSDALAQQARAKEVEILTNLSNTYVALTANERLRGILAEERRKIKELLPVIQERLKVGQGSETDVLNTKVVDANLAVALTNLEAERNTLLARFRQVINHPHDMDMVPSVPRDVTIPSLALGDDRLVTIMEANRPDLKAAAAQRHSAESALKQAKMSPLPDFQLSGQVNNYHAPAESNVPGYRKTYGFMGGITVPIFYPASEHYGIKAARRDLEVAKYQERTQYLSSVSDLHIAISTLKTTQNQIHNYTHLVIPAAKANYELVLTSYSLGKLDYLRLNDARQSWLQAQQDYVAKLLEGAKLFNTIVQQLGCDPSGREGAYACNI